MVKYNRKYTKGKSRRTKSITVRSGNQLGTFKYKNKSRLNKNRVSVNMGLGFPKRVVMTHKYSELLTLSSGLAMGTYSFSANGMFDPNLTGVGHQPYYFDQMTALYDHYTVIGSKVTCKFSPLTTSTVASVCGVFINDDATVTPTSIETLMENSSARWKTLNGAASDPVVFSRKWSAKKTFGGSILGNDNLQGTASTNPSEQSVFTLFYQPLDKSTTQNLYVEVDITYVAVWDELKDIAGS